MSGGKSLTMSCLAEMMGCAGVVHKMKMEDLHEKNGVHWGCSQLMPRDCRMADEEGRDRVLRKADDLHDVGVGHRRNSLENLLVQLTRHLEDE